MRVLIVNTSERVGGAAVAANRLMDALANNGVKARMLVRDRQTDNPSVVRLPRQWLAKWHFLWERLVVLVRSLFSTKHLFEVDIANAGTDITSLREFREADVIHLHWVNQGMLSISVLKKILRSGKPVVWTMHDLWPAAAVCHYARGCNRYKRRCSQCPLLPPSPLMPDLAESVWNRKRQAYAEGSITFVTCSRWLEGEARQSALLSGLTVTSIPNPIDTRVYRPADKAEARRRLNLPEKGRLLLFVSQRITIERKGIAYFIDAIEQLVRRWPENDVQIAMLGSHADEVSSRLALPVHALGYVADEKTIVDVYNAADAYVTPSLEDNLPNTIMEAMACGVPCVGFRVGGIPEMIDHQKNGYVAELRSADDLARGMEWVLREADYESLRKDCVRKVAHNYSQSSVAVRYIEVYQHALAQKHFGI